MAISVFSNLNTARQMCIGILIFKLMDYFQMGKHSWLPTHCFLGLFRVISAKLISCRINIILWYHLRLFWGDYLSQEINKLGSWGELWSARFSCLYSHQFSFFRLLLIHMIIQLWNPVTFSPEPKAVFHAIDVRLATTASRDTWLMKFTALVRDEETERERVRGDQKYLLRPGWLVVF